jgi:hypothetical protein
MRYQRTLFSVAAATAFASTAWVTVLPSAAAQPNPAANVPKVTICHRTNSVTNPYVQETVAESSVDGNGGNDNGQGDHLAEHTGPVFDATNPPPPPHNGDQWGDIIPPFDENGNPRSDPSLTLNWNTKGMAYFENGCNPVDFGNVAVRKLVDNPDGVTTPTTYNIHLTCTIHQGVVNVLNETVSLAADETSESFEVQAGANCDATEEGTAGIANLVSAVSNGPVTVPVDDDALVTITNAFAATPVPPVEVSPGTVTVRPGTVTVSPGTVTVSPAQAVRAIPAFTG